VSIARSAAYHRCVLKRLCILLVTVGAMWQWAQPALAQSAGIDVAGDQSTVAYTGDGGLLLPSSFTGNASQKYAVAACDECVWQYTVYCAMDSVDLCAHAVVTCPVGQIRYRVGFGRHHSDIATIGSVCWGNKQPATRRDVIEHVRNQAVRYLPALLPGLSPAAATVTVVPVIAWTRQPVLFRPPRMLLVGHTVQVSAQGRWLWTWGDGTRQWCALPGRTYPYRDVTHSYTRPGTYEVSVTTDWLAEYTVAGVGTFPVSGPNLNQTRHLRIVVRSARGVLVSH